jgi:hypothetical protein
VSCAVYGRACAERDLASYDDGRLESFDRLIPDLPDDGIRVTIGHDPNLEVGRLVHGEITKDGALTCACVVDDWLVDYPDPVYFGPELLVIGDGVRTRSRFVADAAALTGLSLVTTPATLAAQPVTIVAGDIRPSADRHAWPIGWRTQHPLLKRSLEALGDTYAARTRTARRLLDRRDHDRPPTSPLLQRRDGQVWHGPASPVIGVY